MISFSIWLTVHIASLSDYNLSGMFIPGRERLEGGVGGTGYSYINSVLREWVLRGGKSAEINRLLGGLVKYWGYNLDCIVLLWNHWVPKIDRNSEVTSLDNYSSIPKWKALVQKLSSQEEDHQQQANKGTNYRHHYISSMLTSPLDDAFSSDSFLSFLRLLVSHASLLPSGGKEWKKLKSHIGMKLSRTNVASYGEIGLLRVSTLCLSLAQVTDDSGSMVSLVS
jgi:hypothetical protein